VLGASKRVTAFKSEAVRALTGLEKLLGLPLVLKIVGRCSRYEIGSAQQGYFIIISSLFKGAFYA
jgi:hypothetical protein